MRPFYTNDDKTDTKKAGATPETDGQKDVKPTPNTNANGNMFNQQKMSGDTIPEPVRKPSILQTLQAFFGFGTRKKDNSRQNIGKRGNNREVYPAAQRTNPSEPIRNISSSFTPEVRRLWDSYVKETGDTSETMRKREERYKDMDYMVYNDTIISRAVELYADECAQIDDDYNLIGVESQNPKVAEDIKALFKRLGINQEYVREVAYNLVLYGDSFDIVDCSEGNGVTSVTPVDVTDITSRLEFKASEMKKQMAMQGGTSSWLIPRNGSIERYISDAMAHGNSAPSASFKSYLLGFVVAGSTYLYPWQVNHYRLMSRRSEFWPYGRPLFINLVGPYRQLKTSQNLMAIARAMKFPKGVFEVQTGEDMTTPEKWDAVNMAREEFANTGYLNKNKDGLSLGAEYWMPKELLTYEQYTNDISLEDIADVEYLRENLIIGTGIPKGYLLVGNSDSNWNGQSGASLVQQDKPFGRAVYRIQTAILEGLTNLVRTHFILTKQYEGEFTEFSLALNFPVVETSEDLMEIRSKSLDFATNVISTLKDTLGYIGEIPPEMVKKVFSKFSFLSTEMVDELVDDFMTAQRAENGSGEDVDLSNHEFHADDLSDFEPFSGGGESSSVPSVPEIGGGAPVEMEAPEEAPTETEEPWVRIGSVHHKFVPTVREQKVFKSFREKYNGRLTEDIYNKAIFMNYKKMGVSDIRVGRVHKYVNTGEVSVVDEDRYNFLRNTTSRRLDEEEED